MGAEMKRRRPCRGRALGVLLSLGDTQAGSWGCTEASNKGDVPAEGTACTEAERQMEGGGRGIWELPGRLFLECMCWQFVLILFSTKILRCQFKRTFTALPFCLLTLVDINAMKFRWNTSPMNTNYCPLRRKFEVNNLSKHLSKSFGAKHFILLFPSHRTSKYYKSYRLMILRACKSLSLRLSRLFAFVC